MSKCGGLHCPGCGDGGGGLVALVVVLAISAAVLHAIWHTIVEAAEIVALALVSTVGAVALGGVAYAALRIRAYMLEQQAQRPISVRAEVVDVFPHPDSAPFAAPRAIEQPAVRLHPDQLAELAEILRRSQRPEQQEEGTAR